MSNQQQLRDAWGAFADNLKTMGHDALASAPNDVERVDGLRFVLRQLAYREEQFLEFPSGHRPELFFAESPTRKVFADCPDTIYHQFSVARCGRCRITGTRGESPYVSFTAYRAAVTDRVVADLRSRPTRRSNSNSIRRRAGTGVCTSTTGGSGLPSAATGSRCASTMRRRTGRRTARSRSWWDRMIPVPATGSTRRAGPRRSCSPGTCSPSERCHRSSPTSPTSDARRTTSVGATHRMTVRERVVTLPARPRPGVTHEGI